MKTSAGLPSFFVVVLLVSAAWATAHEQVLYRFSGGRDGASPSSGLLLDTAGNLYGTASAGGDPNDCSTYSIPGCGVVFELTPSAGGKWREHVLHAFHGGTDGIGPSGNLVFDSTGNLFGTTFRGGNANCSDGCGTVFELSPSADGSWNESIIYSFRNGSDGALPAGLVFEGGNLYGVVTYDGGSSGAIYELSPPQLKGEAWTERTLYSFTGIEMQTNPQLLFDGKDTLFGSWYQLYSCYPACGAVFELKRSGGDWQQASEYAFQGGGYGGEPMAGVVMDSQGNLYGTGAEGGNNWGIAFELKRSGDNWTQIMTHNFCSRNNCADGSQPKAPLVFDQAGNLYGTAEGGGTGCSYPGCGVVFELSRVGNRWTETVLYSFKGPPDGSSPVQGLTLDGKGNLFGTTPTGGMGGDSGYGTVFEVTP